MKTKPTYNDAETALLDRKMRLEEETLGIEAKIKRWSLKLEKRQIQLVEVENSLHVLRITNGRTHIRALGKATARNHDLYCAWLAIQKKYGQPNAPERFLQHQLREELQRALPHLKDVTFRSYLSRFKNKGLLEKKGANWRLGKTDKSKEEKV